MAHKKEMLIRLSCDAFRCSSTTIVENYCRPKGWIFIKLQSDVFSEELHFCPGCTFSFEIKLHQHFWRLPDAQTKEKEEEI